MKKLGVFLAIMGLLSVCANATPMDFYTDGTITDGNVFDTVNIWNDATVNMIGGVITFQINIYNISTLNISDGTLESPPSVHINLYDYGILNLSGGQFDNTWIYPDTGTVNIYGRDLSWIIDSEKRVHGYWADDTEFLITFARIENANIIFHEIPEPATMSFLLLGIIGFRKIVTESFLFNN